MTALAGATGAAGRFIRGQVRDEAGVVMFARTVLVLTTLTLWLSSIIRALFGGVPLAPGVAGAIFVVGVLPAFCLSLAIAAPWTLRNAVWFLPLVGPLMLVWITATLGISSEDASVGLLLFLGLAVMFGASQLRGRLAGFITANAVVAFAAVAFSVGPLDHAVHATLWGGTMLTTIAVIFVRLGDQEERQVAELTALVRHDAITGLLSRSFFDETVGAGFARWQAGDRPDGVALVIVDVDRFKTVNDRFGHPTGDRALAHIADVVRAALRPGDVAGRLGGDEFGVWCENISHADAEALAERLVAAVAHAPVPVAPDHPPLRVTVTAGMAHAPTHGDLPVALFRRADHQLYARKGHPRRPEVQA